VNRERLAIDGLIPEPLWPDRQQEGRDNDGVDIIIVGLVVAAASEIQKLWNGGSSLGVGGQSRCENE
jgi:hypothetical protein